MGRPADPHAKIDLLRAAEQVFVEQGLDAAKVEDIAARAGRSKGAFYLHFEHKEDAFKQIVESMLARLATCIDEGALMRKKGAAAMLEHWRAKDVEIFEFVWQNRRVMLLLLEGGKSASSAYLMDEFAERSRINTIKFLEWGIQDGMFRADLDVELTSLLVSGAYDRVARQLVRAETKPDLPTLFANVQRALIAGMGSPATIRLLDASVSKRGSR